MSTSERLTQGEIADILEARGPIDLSLISTTSGSNRWYIYEGWLRWHTPNDEKAIFVLNIHDKNPPTILTDILLTENRTTVDSLDKSWVLARLAELPSTLPTLTKSGIISEIGQYGKIDIAAVSTTAGANKWYMYYERLNFHTSNFEKGIEIRNLGTRNPPTQVSDISLTENKTSVDKLDRSWVLARLAELPSIPAGLTREAIMEEIGRRGEIKKMQSGIPYGLRVGEWYRYMDNVVYDDGGGGNTILIKEPLTQPSDITLIINYRNVDSLDKSWVLARLAELPSTTAAAPITPVTAPLAAPSAEPTEMCRWIKSLMAKGLTEDHGRYVYQLAKGRATLAAQILTFMRATPFMMSTIKVSEDLGRAIYQYAKGRKSLGNKITGCNI